MTEIGYDAKELVERAILNAKPRIGSDAPRWVAVKYAFGLGSSVAHELCRAYGYDPDEIVISPKCEACDAEADDVEQSSGGDKGPVMRVSFTVPMEAIKVECTVDDSDSVVYRPEQK